MGMADRNGACSVLVVFVLTQVCAGAHVSGCPDPQNWPGHPIYDNVTSAYTAPKGRKVLTLLGSADPMSLAEYAPMVTPLFEQLKSTSTLSLLSGGCSGLMGATSVFCAKGTLGETCNGYSGFWRLDYNSTGNDSCIERCETEHFMKMHLLANGALEEEIITGGQSIGLGDAFLLIPGGIGTTREVYDVIQANVEYGGVNKPIFCLNGVDGSGAGQGFYDTFLQWLKHLYKTRLLKAYPGSNGTSLFVSSNSTELAASIDEWTLTGKLPEKLRLENRWNITMPVPTVAAVEFQNVVV